MTFKELEFMFNRSFTFALSKKKFFMLFPSLAICGLIIIFCKALSFSAGKWASLSLAFLPMFACFGILLAMGVLLNRIYYREVKQMDLTYKNIFSESLTLLMNSTYLSLPFVLLYLVLWMIMGFFYLLKEIPAIGDFMGVILSFAPFIIVLVTLLLAISALLLLFFATPHISLKNRLHIALFEEIFLRLRQDLFLNICLFLVALMPLVLVGSILLFSATVTGLHFSIQSSSLAMAMQWFFIMIPFSALIAPAIVFFFNFSMESYNAIQKKQKLQT